MQTMAVILNDLAAMLKKKKKPVKLVKNIFNSAQYIKKITPTCNEHELSLIRRFVLFVFLLDLYSLVCFTLSVHVIAAVWLGAAVVCGTGPIVASWLWEKTKVPTDGH